MSIINWLKQNPQYISITTEEKTNSVWGLDWALENGTTMVDRWESLPEFCSYLESLALPADPNQPPNRPREIALYSQDQKVFDRLNLGQHYSSDSSPFVIVTPFLQEPFFQVFLTDFMEETGVSPTFRAILFDDSPNRNYRSDIRDLLITLIKI